MCECSVSQHFWIFVEDHQWQCKRPYLWEMLNLNSSNEHGKGRQTFSPPTIHQVQ